MILDSQLKFSDSQAVTVDAVGTNVIDLAVARSIGSGEPLAVMFSVIVAADQTTGDESYTFDVEYATNAAQTTGRQLMGRRIFEAGTPTAPAQNADLLVSGFKFFIPLPPVTLDEAAEFIGIRYDAAGNTPIITVSANLMPLRFVDSYADYANNYNIE